MSALLDRLIPVQIPTGGMNSRHVGTMQIVCMYNVTRTYNGNVTFGNKELAV